MDELREALELATDEELELLSEVLFRPKFNPLDYWQASQREDLPRRSHRERLGAIEERFRFLAADGVTVLQGRSDELSYREILLQVGQYLRINPRIQSALAQLYTDDLEAEVFLHLMQQCWKRLPEDQRHDLGRQLELTNPGAKPVWQSESLRLILEGGGALALSTVVTPVLLRQMAQQLAIQLARYQALQGALQQGGGWLMAMQGRLGLNLVRRGVAAQAVRYGTVRGVLAVVGPALWIWFFADLGWRAIATNYGRIIPAIFILAQIRLTRATDLSTATPS